MASAPAFVGHQQSGGKARGRNLVGTDRLARPHQFVARGEDGDLRPAADIERAVPHGGGKRDMARIQTKACLQEHVAGAEVETGGADMAIGTGRLLHRHPVAGAFRVFLQHHRIGAIRNGRPGEDPHGLHGSDHSREAGSGSTGADHAEGCRNLSAVGAAHRIAIHGGSRKGRLVAQGADILGEGAAGAGGEGGSLDPERRRDIRQHAGEGILDRYQAHGASKSPERPPLLRRRRTLSIRMPLSAAFTIS